ncbi:MAG: SEC-C domain-containing protein, partial [Bacteroidales bacterium]|nr:SEC-C domain-containing protein [Bacteroidales bacterium]
KWCLQGRSAREAGECLCDLDACKAHSEEREVLPQPGEEYPQWSMPEPTVSEGYGGLTSDFPLGFAIPHVAPDDPCPCGSGLRYCRCHGKFLS